MSPAAMNCCERADARASHALPGSATAPSAPQATRTAATRRAEMRAAVTLEQTRGHLPGCGRALTEGCAAPGRGRSRPDRRGRCDWRRRWSGNDPDRRRTPARLKKACRPTERCRARSRGRGPAARPNSIGTTRLKSSLPSSAELSKISRVPRGRLGTAGTSTRKKKLPQMPVPPARRERPGRAMPRAAPCASMRKYAAAARQAVALRQQH